MKLSNRNLAIETAYKKGYRAVDGEIIGCRSGRPISLYVRKAGYPGFVCRFSVGETRKRIMVDAHRLAAYQKYGDKIFEDGIEVRHLDGNKMNFHEDNISIGTCRDNHYDMTKKQRRQRSRNGIIACSKVNRKWTDEEVRAIRDRYNDVQSYSVVMEEFGISSKGTLHYILHHDYNGGLG